MRKVFIVDDEAQVREYLKKYLEYDEFFRLYKYENPGYSVYTVSSKEEAKEIIHMENFDFILIDLRLNDPTEFGGIEVFQWVRKAQPLAQPIILSAYPFADQVEEEFKKQLKDEPNLDKLIDNIREKHYVSKVRSETNYLFGVLNKLQELQRTKE